MAKEYKDLVVGLDIGTAKVMVVVAEVMPGGELKLAGLGVAPSNGLKRGVVVNIDATVQSIQQALREAELMADCKITRVFPDPGPATTKTGPSGAVTALFCCGLSLFKKSIMMGAIINALAGAMPPPER